MNRPIKFRFTMINTNTIFGYALRDCTVGKVYEGTFVPQGSSLTKGHPDIHIIDAPYDTLVFHDDCGDLVHKFLLPEDCEYEEVTNV